jgi:magnesium transporter
MVGIVTVDDIVDVVEEEASRDIQNVGGTEALDAPYLETTFFEMVKKRAGWLAILFVGEMFTATAMSFFEDEIAKAVVLALFLPLIISSGGNSGSQATTLVIQAMATGDVRLRDWFRVIRRELFIGLALGCTLGIIGLIRIFAWQSIFHTYGAQTAILALTILCSLIGVVAFGTLAGSMLPFILRRCGLNPASASAPFVATLVDVTCLVIYFTIAKAIMLKPH